MIRHSASRYVPNRCTSIKEPKVMCKKIYRPKLETIQCSLVIVILSYNEIFTVIRNKLVLCIATRMSLENIALSERSQIQENREN